MTEKRFSVVCCVTDWYIEDKLISPFAVLTPHQVSDLLNELYNENKQLKSETEKLVYANEDLLSEKRNWQKMSDEYCKLSEENEQLKKAERRLYEYFRKCFDNVSEEGFQETWEVVKNND